MKYVLLIHGDGTRMNTATPPGSGMSHTATSIRVRGKTDVPDLDHAVAGAERCQAAEHGTIEIRPVWPTHIE